jgi:hypothetical protein
MSWAVQVVGKDKAAIAARVADELVRQTGGWVDDKTREAIGAVGGALVAALVAQRPLEGDLAYLVETDGHVDEAVATATLRVRRVAALEATPAAMEVGAGPAQEPPAPGAEPPKRE